VAEPRRGTVTFLFTDVEGSTRLLKQLGERYGAVLAEHQRILREAFAAHGGDEVDTQGDAFFYVFSRARDAAAAGAAAQRALAEHEWPDGLECRVRIGMHTGEPDISDEGRYHGLGVHRTARIMAAGHGGQILASQATASVLADNEPAGTRLRYLGEYRLKDLDRPERIYQLDVDGLPQRFPALHTGAAPFWTRRRLVAAGAGVASVAAAAAVAALVLGGEAQALSDVDANAVGLVNSETGKISHQIEVGATPTHIAVGEGAIWVTNTDSDTVSRIDPDTRAVVQTIAVGSSPSGITTGNGSVWVANSLQSTVERIDPGTNTVVQPIAVGTFPVGVVYAKGSVWVANAGDGTITRIDAETGEAAKKALAIPATELAFGAETLWATQRAAKRVVRIDPTSRKVVAEIGVGNGPTGVAFGHGAAWVANTLDGTVSRIDPATNSLTAVIPVGNGPTDVATDARGVWVSNQFDGTLARIDPGTNGVTPFGVGNRPQGVAVLDGHVLVTVRESGAGHRGGTLTIRLSRETDAIDPAVAYDSISWPILRMTNDGLVALNQASGLAGTQLVPNLALALPTPTDGGRTYAFRLRRGIVYSTGRPVRASDVRASFERLFKVGKLAVSYYDGIAGVARCKQRPKRCDLSRGIEADDNAGTVTFHLVAPDPEFLYKLALSFTYVLPAGTPPKDTGAHPLPATGPYMIASYRAKRRIELVRNPRFHEWSQAAQPDGYPDRIVFDIGGTPDEAVNDVLEGQADLFSSSLPQTPPSNELLTVLKTQHASRLRTNPQGATIALFLNTRLPPFNRVQARRALNFAVDRAAAAEAVGGGEIYQITCQILPPHYPGYQPYCPYTAGNRTGGTWTAPDLAKARALVAASGTRGMKVFVFSWGELPGLGPFAVKLLRSLGYRTSMKVKGGFDYFLVAGDSRTKAQVGITEWISDYPAASGFFSPTLTCTSFLPNSPQNSNNAQFCNPGIDRQIERAAVAQATNPDAAGRLWQSIDRQTVDQAPWVPLVNPKAVDVLAERVGNYQFSPQFGVLLDQLWVR
jgi:peptide/nickel transport system substrate-binding protein